MSGVRSQLSCVICVHGVVYVCMYVEVCMYVCLYRKMGTRNRTVVEYWISEGQFSCDP